MCYQDGLRGPTSSKTSREHSPGQEEHHSPRETEQRGTEGTGVPTYRTDVRQGSAESVGCEPKRAGTFIRRWPSPPGTTGHVG